MSAKSTVFARRSCAALTRLACAAALMMLLPLVQGCGGAGGTSPGGQQPLTGTATLSWQAPATNVDGTPLLDLAGYRIHYGTASGDYTDAIDVGAATTYEVTGLPAGRKIYFTVTAYATDGSESGYSNEVSKLVN